MEHQNTTTFVSLEMKEVKMMKETQKGSVSHSDHPMIVVRFNLEHYREIHHFCEDDESPFPQDHNILSKVLDEESSFGFELVFPLEPETVEFYVACAEIGEDWPDSVYVCSQVWEDIKQRVSEYVLVHADFDGNLGFQMLANVGVSTLDIPCC